MSQSVTTLLASSKSTQSPAEGKEEVEVERPKTTLTLPYIKGLSEAIKRVLPHSRLCSDLYRLSARCWYAKRTRSQSKNVKELCTPSLVWSAQACTSARQGGSSSSMSISEHCHALKNGDIQTSTLAEHVLKTGHAVDLSQSEVLDHHQKKGGASAGKAGVSSKKKKQEREKTR